MNFYWSSLVNWEIDLLYVFIFYNFNLLYAIVRVKKNFIHQFFLLLIFRVARAGFISILFGFKLVNMRSFDVWILMNGKVC